VRICLLLAALIAALVFDTRTEAAAQFDWSVQNRFRFYKSEESMKPHADAFQKVLKDHNGVRPPNAIELVERILNQNNQRGWANSSFWKHCYGSERSCQRQYGTRPAKEDYIRPASHAVTIALRQSDRPTTSVAVCKWDWKPKTGNGSGGSKDGNCTDSISVDEVPWPGGIRAGVTLPDGKRIEQDIVVKDYLLVALGDSLASADGNPDQPIRVHPSWAMNYHYSNTKNVPLAVRNTGKPGRFSEDSDDPDFRRARSKWVEAKCHRSQYSHQFRAALQLAIEHPQAAVTLIFLPCSGAELTEGLFARQSSRERPPESSNPGADKWVDAQAQRVFDLLCKDGAARNPQSVTLREPYRDGRPAMVSKTYQVRTCATGDFKRPIDAILMTFGGNDVGFSSLVGYTIINQSKDIARVAPVYERFSGRQLIFDTKPARVYLDSLDENFLVVKRFFDSRLGVSPGKVIQTGYAALHNDENGALCAGTKALDVHPAYAFRADRIKEVDEFGDDFFKRLACIHNAGPGCPTTLKTERGTGFAFVTSHQETFAKRGLCAASDAEKPFLIMPKLKAGSFGPWNPAQFHPYRARTRLVVSPNDAFLTANTHQDRGTAPAIHEGVQLLFASLYSGAFHPTAEGQAIIADHTYPELLKVLGLKP
jgi:hypothetical protein